jgi:1,6-anhydro-N-acetylmuramate kinase
MLIAGIMTGTSLDAIDVAVCDIQHKILGRSGTVPRWYLIEQL